MSVLDGKRQRVIVLTVSLRQDACFPVNPGAGSQSCTGSFKVEFAAVQTTRVHKLAAQGLARSAHRRSGPYGQGVCRH